MENAKVLVARNEHDTMINTTLCYERVCKLGLTPGPQYLGAHQARTLPITFGNG